jgi:hypothetical protein
VFLEIKETHTYFGKSHILHGVSMEVEKGEIVALVGRRDRFDSRGKKSEDGGRIKSADWVLGMCRKNAVSFLS